MTKAEARAQSMAPSGPANGPPGPVARTTHPHGTSDESEWRAISQPLAQAVRKTTGGRPDVFIAGSAVTGESFADKPGRPRGTPFDHKSDFDMGIASDTLYEHVEATDKSHLSHDDGPKKTRALGPRELNSLGLPDLASGVRELRERSGGRKVSVAIFESDSARQANAGRAFIKREHSPPPRRAHAASSPSAPAPAASNHNNVNGKDESKEKP
jgi:hypothetical protein